MHLGNLRTSLAAWLASRSSRATLVLRIEDLDGPRVRPGAAGMIVDDLRWLGLDWDEGPDVGGTCAPYFQGQRGHLYAAALDRLRQRGLAYPCACSRAEVAASAPHFGEGERIYAGACRSRDPEEVVALARSRGRVAAWRFRMPAGLVEFQDALFGQQRDDPSLSAGDFVIARSDGAWAYQLAVVVDDGAMAITDVWRGADLLASVGRQVRLFEALGLDRPRWGHVPLVLSGVSGEKLSKRDRPVSVEELRAGGMDPLRLTAILARSLGLEAPGPCRPIDLVEAWKPTAIGLEDGPIEIDGPN